MKQRHRHLSVKLLLSLVSRQLSLVNVWDCVRFSFMG